MSSFQLFVDTYVFCLNLVEIARLFRPKVRWGKRVALSEAFIFALCLAWTKLLACSASAALHDCFCVTLREPFLQVTQCHLLVAGAR